MLLYCVRGTLLFERVSPLCCRCCARAPARRPRPLAAPVAQEFSITTKGVCPRYIYVHLFIDGILMTFLGVWLITSNRLPAEGLLTDGDDMMSPAPSATADSPYGSPDPLASPPPRGTSTLGFQSSLVALDEEHTERVGLPAGLGGVTPPGCEADGAVPNRRASRRLSGIGILERMEPAFDARDGRMSRSNSMLTKLAAGLTGGKSVSALMYDPQDHWNKQESATRNYEFRARSMSIQRTHSRLAYNGAPPEVPVPPQLSTPPTPGGADADAQAESYQGFYGDMSPPPMSVGSGFSTSEIQTHAEL